MFGRRGIEDVPVLGQLPYVGAHPAWSLGAAAIAADARRTSASSCSPSATTRARRALSGVRVDEPAHASRSSSRRCSAAVAGDPARRLRRRVRRRSARGWSSQAITAVVLGGVVLGGGRGSVARRHGRRAHPRSPVHPAQPARASPARCEYAVQGVIIIAAVAVALVPLRGRRDDRHTAGSKHPEEASRGDEDESGAAAAMVSCAAVRGGVRRLTTSDDARRAGRHGDRRRRGRADTGEQSKFFVQADYDAQLAQRDGEPPQGPADKPWEQALEPEMVDTAKYKEEAGAVPPLLLQRRRQQPVAAGRLEDHAGRGRAAPGDHRVHARVDAEGKDDKQISDIERPAAARAATR